MVNAPTTDQIRSQIAHTRMEMSHTIDAIQARLSPRTLMSDGRERIKRAATRRVVSLARKATNGATGLMKHSSQASGSAIDWVGSALDWARCNPRPAAVAGAGAAAGLILSALWKMKRS
jgi:hypothetical protein